MTTPRSDTDSFRVAYLAGVAEHRVVDAPNPYLPAEPGTRRLRLAQLWQQGRHHDIPARLKRD